MFRADIAKDFWDPGGRALLYQREWLNFNDINLPGCKFKSLSSYNADEEILLQLYTSLCVAQIDTRSTLTRFLTEGMHGAT